jgi:hypothetical protein
LHESRRRYQEDVVAREVGPAHSQGRSRDH